jgi:hypothetical protein
MPSRAFKALCIVGVVTASSNCYFVKAKNLYICNGKICKFAALLLQRQKFFGPNSGKIFKIVGYIGADYFVRYVTRYNSPQTKCNRFIVTGTNGLMRVLLSYLGMKCTKPSS